MMKLLITFIIGLLILSVGIYVGDNYSMEDMEESESKKIVSLWDDMAKNYEGEGGFNFCNIKTRKCIVVGFLEPTTSENN